MVEATYQEEEVKCETRAEEDQGEDEAEYEAWRLQDLEQEMLEDK